jgi:hypothetical protein
LGFIISTFNFIPLLQFCALPWFPLFIGAINRL